MADQTTTPYMGSRTYDVLKWIAQIFLPAVGALYFSLADLWNLPKATEVVGTITIVDTFLGVLLNLSKTAYNKSDAPYDADLIVTEDHTGGKVANLAFDENKLDPYDVDKRKTLTLKVIHKKKPAPPAPVKKAPGKKSPARPKPPTSPLA